LPAICAHCAEPADDTITGKTRIGRRTRFLDFPVCRGCHERILQLSVAEEKVLKTGRRASLIGGIAVAAILFILLPAALGWPLKLLESLAAGVAVWAAVVVFVRRRYRKAISPEKMEIIEAARIVDFSWRATTFEFQNDRFSEQFLAINEALLMQLPDSSQQ